MQKHYSVGAIIKRENKYLLIDRLKVPYGYACIAGHRNSNESDEDAIDREVGEESNLIILKKKLIYAEVIPWNTCSRGVDIHDWKVYECEVVGDVKINPEEARGFGWYTEEEISKLRLEPVWKHFFEKLYVLRS